jgi:endogenous inhibitor of DNA gyrase (YacG/DUF329 family)
MTIRQYIRRRWLITTWSVSAGIIAILLLSRSDLPRQHPLVAVLALAGLFGCVATQALIMRRTKCPRCATELGWAASQAAYGKGRDASRCPHCGVNFDDPMESRPKPP